MKEKNNKAVEELKLYVTKAKRACRMRSINRVFKEAEKQRKENLAEENKEETNQS